MKADFGGQVGGGGGGEIFLQFIINIFTALVKVV